ncbi:uncharacterized protein [Heterodontus francisci]|uniref:uncharacterized protein n=1 Tax=Heterodontus francisci TaxID=7792 RepID=UPI00355BA09C
MLPMLESCNYEERCDGSTENNPSLRRLRGGGGGCSHANGKPSGTGFLDFLQNLSTGFPSDSQSVILGSNHVQVKVRDFNVGEWNTFQSWAPSICTNTPQIRGNIFTFPEKRVYHWKKHRSFTGCQDFQEDREWEMDGRYVSSRTLHSNSMVYSNRKGFHSIDEQVHRLDSMDCWLTGCWETRLPSTILIDNPIEKLRSSSEIFRIHRRHMNPEREKSPTVNKV